MAATPIYLDPRITMPISEAIHQVLEACGYSLVKQEMLTLVYEKEGAMRLDFSYGLCVVAEMFHNNDENGMDPRWHLEYGFRSRRKMEDLQVLEMLQAWQMIDYKALPDYKRVMYEAYNTVKHSGSSREAYSLHG